MSEEQEAHPGLRPRAVDIQSEVDPYDDQWFHTEQANHEAPSEEHCDPGVDPSD